MKKIILTLLIVLSGFMPFATDIDTHASNGYRYDTEVQDVYNQDVSEEIVDAFLLFLMTMWVILVPILLASYVYRAYTLMSIARKLDEPDAWFAWIPILDLILLFKLGDKNPMYLLLLLIPGFGSLAIYIMQIIAYMNISEKLGRDRMLGLLKIIPSGELILIGVLNWGTPSNIEKKKEK